MLRVLDRIANLSFSSSAHRAQGFTLLEVLIAFFVLSIGLMGVAGLQSLSKSSQFEAIQRTRAVALADMVIEMIRNNPLGVAAYDTGVALGGGTIGTAPTPDCLGTECTPPQLAARDLWEFEQALDGLTVSFDSGGTTVAAGGLREPVACITFFTPVPGMTRSGQVDVRIQWRGLESTTDAVTDTVEFCAGAAVGSDPFRRQLVVGTYIVDETEL